MASSAPKEPEGIRRRYTATLLTQCVQMMSSAVTAAIVPRALGPIGYGNYNFLLSTAATLRGFLEPSAQQSFFTFSSQDDQTGPLTKLYCVSLVIQLALTLSIIGVSAIIGITGWFWPSQKLNQIAWVTLMDWVIFLGLSLRQLGDSKSLTVCPQAISALVSMIAVVGLIGLLRLGWLNLYTYVWLNLSTGLLSGAALGYYLLVRHGDLCWKGSLHGNVWAYLRRWWHYAAPLIAVEYYTPFVAWLSIYLVQTWYGSVEQGYFALASRWSALVLVFSSSALMIMWREIANAMGAGDRARAAHVYFRFNRLLFFLALTLCCWLSMSSRTLVAAFAGDEYGAAVPVLMIMAFYPLQQTAGQISTAALKGAEQTKVFRNLSMLLSIPDLALTYLLLAPPTAAVPGLGLGAIGVAIRMVGYGLLSVQAYEWSSFRLFGLSYGRSLAQNLACAGVAGISAIGILGGLEGLLRVRLGLNSLLSLGVVSPLYFVFIGVSIFVWPRLIGFSRSEVVAQLRWLRQRGESLSKMVRFAL